ncbi:SH3 domain-containing protein [Komarekiella sp. 'clone 1']|uniref:SH3 domain-containing protein n=1 Tax=Komarekiella delphini-convector SJRDD-AB1 TaxID=2593771 RepID=A0AA40T1P7_9NOST|nr:SH3 domain-containing protein [Komarekiella delphini-convector]MBD6619298.1 SH3 domain-containing protein [Komarekiella delphini-convector SJRDD-AB1]
MFKTIMTSVLILTAALPANAEVGPGLGNTDSVASRSQSYAQVCTNDGTGRLSMRNGPGRNFRKVKEIPNGDVVVLTGGKYSQDGYWWWNVSHSRGRGWVRADYVCGDPQ